MNTKPTNGRTAVIVGASGGIGRALTRALCQRPGWRVVALSRGRPDQTLFADRSLSAEAECGSAAGRLHWQQIDTTDPLQLAAAAARTATDHGRVHLLINCLGVLHGSLHGSSGDASLSPEKSLSALRLENLQHSVAVNAFAPLAALQAFLPLLRHEEGAVAATLSAMVGSIADNALGGWYSYRMSKAALNMGLRNAAIECARLRDGPCVVAIHPGTTLTALSEPFVRRHAHRSPAESAEHILQVLAGLSAEDTGKFLNWDGREIPW